MSSSWQCFEGQLQNELVVQGVFLAVINLPFCGAREYFACGIAEQQYSLGVQRMLRCPSAAIAAMNDTQHADGTQDHPCSLCNSVKDAQ